MAYCAASIGRLCFSGSDFSFRLSSYALFLIDSHLLCESKSIQLAFGHSFSLSGLHLGFTMLY
jgi:hypothetical protein